MSKQKTNQKKLELNREKYVRLLVAVVSGNVDPELKSWAELELLKIVLQSAGSGATAI